MAQRLVFNKAKSVELEDFTPGELGPNDVLIKNRYSLMSTGTENIVFNRLFDEGTHWAGWVKYPFYPGYTTVGQVIAVGDEVKDIEFGAMVAHRGGHGSEHIQNADGVYPIPDGLDLAEAVWFALAKISFMGAKAADYTLGDSVLVIGAGPIGQTTIRWASAAGAGKIAVVDMVEKRLGMAKAGGADITYNRPLSEDLKDTIMADLGGKLPDIVIDTTGHPAVFGECLKIAKRQGKVVVLGDTGMPAQQHLTPDVVTRGITIVGAHDGLAGGDWPENRIIDLFFSLVNTGRYKMAGLNTHTFTPEQCADAYQLANTSRGETMGILFNWNNQ